MIIRKSKTVIAASLCLTLFGTQYSIAMAQDQDIKDTSVAKSSIQIEKLEDFAQKAITKQYDSLVEEDASTFNTLKSSSFDKQSTSTLNKELNNEITYMDQMNAKYTYTKVNDIETIDSTILDNNTIQLKQHIKAEKTWAYENKPEQPTTTLESKDVVLTIDVSQEPYQLINYEAESDSTLAENSEKNANPNLPTIDEMIAEQEAAMKSASNQIAPMAMYSYDRLAAKSYAYNHWDTRNPDFRQFLTNCTNFISQAINVGGKVNMDWGDPLIWWYQGSQNSTSWSVAHDYVYFGNRNNDQDGGLAHVYTSSVKDLKIGSLVGYDFEDDGYFDHIAMVVNYDANGEPLVAQNTYDAWNKPWRSTSSGTKHYFIQTNSNFYVN